MPFCLLALIKRERTGKGEVLRTSTSDISEAATKKSAKSLIFFELEFLK